MIPNKDGSKCVGCPPGHAKLDDEKCGQCEDMQYFDK